MKKRQLKEVVTLLFLSLFPWVFAIFSLKNIQIKKTKKQKKKNKWKKGRLGWVTIRKINTVDVAAEDGKTRRTGTSSGKELFKLHFLWELSTGPNRSLVKHEPIEPGPNEMVSIFFAFLTFSVWFFSVSIVNFLSFFSLLINFNWLSKECFPLPNYFHIFRFLARNVCTFNVSVINDFKRFQFVIIII